MITKVENDLGITHRRARKYVDLFHKKFNGNYHAITHMSATHIENGNVKISYIIANTKYQMVLDVSNVYAEETNKRTSFMTDGSQVVKLLGVLFPDVSGEVWENDWVNTFEFTAHGYTLHIRVDELPSLSEVVAAMKSCCINLSSVGIETRSGHLTITITNFNIKTKEDIQFINN